MAADNASPCSFAAGRLKSRVRAFAAETDGVRTARDTECIHRMRVASRRLRSALPIFAFCFKKRQYKRWMANLKGVARALGEARDTDVQLAFLDRYERSLPKSPPPEGGLTAVRTILFRRREEEQERIVSELDNLERSGVLKEISQIIRGMKKERQRRRSLNRYDQPLRESAADTIESALGDLLSFEPVLRDPDNIRGHHAVRIAAKKHRYTLEIFRPLSEDRLTPAIRSLKRIQEILGELHDCDVWIAFLSGLRTASETGSVRDDGITERTGLHFNGDTEVPALLDDRISARNTLYLKLVREWDMSVGESLKEYLRSATSTILQRPDVPVPEKTGSVQSPTTGLPADLAALYPDTDGHSRQVAGIALRLFDELAPLHGYSGKERRLIEYAGLLHDIGWAYGQKGHNTRSCRMILADRTLPVSQRERTIIGLVARYHRKTVPKNPFRSGPDMTAKDRRRVLVLSALLRIADGLDYTHNRRVVSLSCATGPDAVTCYPVFDGDGRIERERALLKSDLFERVFRRRFEIA